MTTLKKIPVRSRTSARYSLGRFSRDEGGGPAVEFALIAPVLILLIFGIVQFGFAFYTYNEMLNGAREAARRMAVGASEQTAEEWARNSMALPREYVFATDAATDSVTMTITLPLSQAMVVSVLPLPDLVTEQLVTASVTMRRE